MTTDVDHNIYAATRSYLDFAAAHPPSSGQPRPRFDETAVFLSEYSRAGLMLNVRQDVDYFATMPGGQALLIRGAPPTYPPVTIIDLDMTFDMSDPILRRLRDPVVAALADTGTPFIPVSGRAVQNTVGGPRMWASLELIDRDGLQCVFRVGERCYISGYDANEDPPLYFLARLPHEVTTYAEAIEALKPRSVKLAEAQGLRVRRQGDMFAIPTTWRSHDLRAMGAVFSTNVTINRRMPRVSSMARWTIMISGDEVPAESVESAEAREIEYLTVTHSRRRGLYGTAHTATELAYLPDGTMFARGRIEHDPRGVREEGRDPDHQPLPLPGKTWWLVAKNTVPIQERG